MHANNEVGTIQPIAESRVSPARPGDAARDGVQALGKIPVDVEALGVDLYSMSATSSMPRKVWALSTCARDRYRPHRLRRASRARPAAGTENVPGIAAFGAAAELAARTLAAESERLRGLRDRLEKAALERIPRSGVNGSRARRTPNTPTYTSTASMANAVIALDLAASGLHRRRLFQRRHRAFHVLPHGLSAERARASMRFSLGRSNTEEQVDALVEAL